MTSSLPLPASLSPYSLPLSTLNILFKFDWWVSADLQLSPTWTTPALLDDALWSYPWHWKLFSCWTFRLTCWNFSFYPLFNLNVTSFCEHFPISWTIINFFSSHFLSSWVYMKSFISWLLQELSNCNPHFFFVYSNTCDFSNLEYRYNVYFPLMESENIIVQFVSYHKLLYAHEISNHIKKRTLLMLIMSPLR